MNGFDQVGNMLFVVGQVGFASPGWLWLVPIGGALVLMAHLLSRAGGRTVAFPAMRFVHEAVSQAARLATVRDRILMATRVLLLTFVALCFAQPSCTTRQSATATGDGVMLLLVVDRSASMTRSKAGITLLDDARARADQLIAGLNPSSDLANVIVLDAAPAALLPTPTGNFSALRDLVGAITPSSEFGDEAAAWSLLLNQVERAQNANAAQSSDKPTRRQVRIVWLGDGQASQLAPPPWLQLRDVGARLDRPIPADLPVANVLIGRITNMPNEPMVGQRVRTRASVAGLTDTPRGIALDRSLVQPTVDNDQPSGQSASTGPTGTDDQPDPADQSNVTVQADATDRVRVMPSDIPDARVTADFEPWQAGQAGLWSVTARITPEGGVASNVLTVDDQLGLTAAVTRGRDVLVVSGQSPHDSSQSLFFLLRAIDPLGYMPGDTAVSQVAGPWRVGLVSDSDQLPTRAAEAGDVLVVVIHGLPAPMTDPRRALLPILERGGGVLVLVANEYDAAVLGSLWPGSRGLGGGDDQSPVITGNVRGWSSPGAGQDPTFMWGRFGHPVLAMFQGPSRTGLLDVTPGPIWSTTAGDGRAAVGGFTDDRTLLTGHDDLPALAVADVESGKVAGYLASLDPAASDMVRSSVFAPLVHELMRYTSPGRPTPQQWVVGRSVDPTVLIDQTGSVRWFGSGGEPLSTNWQTRVPGVGWYEARDASGRVVALHFARVDRRESDLDQASADALLDPSQAGVASGDGAGTNDGVMLHDRVIDLWPWMAVGALAMLIAEGMVLSLGLFGGYRGRWSWKQGGRS